MIEIADLVDAAQHVGLDEHGQDEHALALAVLVAAGVNVDAPAAPLAGDLVPIRDHDLAYVAARAIRVAANETARLSPADRATVEATLGTGGALRWLARSGARIDRPELIACRERGQIRAVVVAQQLRWHPDDLAKLARRILVGGCR